MTPKWSLRLKSHRAHWSWDGTFYSKIPNDLSFVSVVTCVGILCTYGSMHAHITQTRPRCSAYVEGPHLHRTFPNIPPSGSYKNVLSVRIHVQFNRVQEALKMYSLSERIIRGLQRQQSWAFCVHHRTRIALEPCWRVYPFLMTIGEFPRAFFCHGHHMTLWWCGGRYVLWLGICRQRWCTVACLPGVLQPLLMLLKGPHSCGEPQQQIIRKLGSLTLEEVL